MLSDVPGNSRVAVRLFQVGSYTIINLLFVYFIGKAISYFLKVFMLHHFQRGCMKNKRVSVQDLCDSKGTAPLVFHAC